MLTTQKNMVTKLIGGYRYSFNGKEKIDEVAGSGNTIDFGARIYDARVGRWMSRDPLEHKFPSISPYVFTKDNPIYFCDPDGMAPDPGTLTVTAAHKLFIKKIGIKAYQQARERGFSVHGSLIFVGLSMNESGWNDETAINNALRTNNFYGLGGADDLAKFSQPTVEAGIEQGLNQLEKNWPDAYSLLFSANVDLDQLDVALENGVNGVYNDEEDRRSVYGTFIGEEMLPGIIDRFKTVLSEEIYTLELQVQDYENQMEMVYQGILEKSASDPNYINSKEFENDQKNMWRIAVKRFEKNSELKELQKMYDEIDAFSNSTSGNSASQTSGS